MPEPQKMEETEDKWDRNIDDPFWTADGKSKVVEKLRFVCLPVFIGIHRAFLWPWQSMTDFGQKYWATFGICLGIALCPPLGSLAMTTWYRMCRMIGFHPHSLNFRYAVVGNYLQFYLSGVWGIRCTSAVNWHNYTGGQWWDLGADAACFRMFAATGFMIGFNVIAPTRFQDRSAYGMYCCAPFGQMRLVRLQFLKNFLFYWNFYVTRYLMSISRDDGVLGTVIAPAMVFAWKRVLYFEEVSSAMHDSPFKGHMLVANGITCLMCLNMSVTRAQCSVATFMDSITYVVIDWFIYGLRVIIVGRLGYKQCPKVITYLVVKQLENLPWPLPSHVTAQGDKTAMRVVQAYMCLLEGETMTTMFVMHMIQYLVLFVLIRENAMMALVPSRNAWILTMYSALDLVQDFLADAISAKFCHWSYIYKTTDGSYYSKRLIPFTIISGIAVGNEWTYWVGGGSRIQNANFIRYPFAMEWGYASSGGGHF
eukprot:gnl/MRDRNA2_/MRDRNA2_82422_c0_seq1.p1 gnl/MRDRNA2_/MRDRNA2_82422_c0~~gnl/MRDRNA2_/MRDRNA2_82422_c0_seq1.p1  ORF type:complete len:480 (+),score=25.71 gnl/MRDRNA2_/MRDRNA2_82422_c0_seq1:119-1558(+)